MTAGKQDSEEFVYWQTVSFATSHEDVVLMRAFAGRKNGYFVDVGAADPMLASVVKNLSEHLDWTGVHIEPNQDFADRLKKAYPRDHVIQAVVGEREGQVEFFEVDDGWLSTADPQAASTHAAEGRSVTSRVTEMTTLDSILHAAGAPSPIDLLKIDVEGTEPQVLAGFSFETWKPRVIVVETTVPMQRKRAANDCSELLVAKGYRHTLFDGCNDFYVGPGESDEFVEALSVPANVFDQFAPMIWYLQIDEDKRPPVRFAPRSLM